MAQLIVNLCYQLKCCVYHPGTEFKDRQIYIKYAWPSEPPSQDVKRKLQCPMNIESSGASQQSTGASSSDTGETDSISVE